MPDAPDNTPDHRAEFLDTLYGVALEPERFDELVECWSERLADAIVADDGNAGERAYNLSEHVRRAEALIDLTISQEANLPKSIGQRLHAEVHAAFAVDRDGIVRGANDSASSLYAIREKQPLSTLPFDEEAIAELANYAAMLGSPEGHPVGPAIVRAYRSGTDSAVILSLNSWTTASGRRLLIAKSVDFNWPDRLSEPVQRAFALTDAEMAVMKLLAEGNGAPAIARMRKASVLTVRAQIRSIYDKTATHSLNEFMRMALGLMSLGLVEVDAAAGVFASPSALIKPPYPRAEHRHMLTLPDGRTLDYALFGADEGPVLLFMHDEFFGDGWTAPMAERAESEGVRVLAQARPGNGRSSPYPQGSTTYEQATADALCLLDRLGIDKVVLRCFMAGAHFAFALADAAPDRVAGLLIQAPILPLGGDEDERRLNRFHKVLSGIIHRSSGLLNFVTRAGMAYHNRVGTRRFFRTFAEGRAADIAALDDDETFAAMSRGAEICGAQGHLGFYSDYRQVLPNMARVFEELKMPIIVLAGEAALPKIDPGLIAIARRHPQCTLRIVPGGDHYLHFTHSDAVMDAIVELARPGREAGDQASP